MKTQFFKSMALAAAMIAAAGSVSAKQYCHEPLTQGSNTIYLTCQKFSEGNYQILIEGENLSGLGGSFLNVNGVGGYDLRTNMTVAEDGTSITCNITSNTDPSFYTPLYVLMPGEVNFGQPDITWGICEGTEQDTEAPVMGNATLVEGSVTHNSAQINVTATDNVGVSAYHIVDAGNSYDNTLSATDNVLTLTGLKSNTTYNLTITAKDAQGNESANSATVNLTTATLLYKDFPTGHLGNAEFGDVTGRILLTIQKENANTISFIVKPAIENAEQPIDFINVIVNGTGKSLGDKTASVAGEKLTFDGLASLDNMTVNVQWHTPSVGEGLWTTNNFTVNESELYTENGQSVALVSALADCAIYPNPVADVLNIRAESPIARVAVFNLAGQAVLAAEPAANCAAIDCSALPQGSYAVSIRLADGRTTTHKMVK